MKRRGFTLIEMLIVVSVLGILATIAVPRIRDAQERAMAAALIERVAGVRLAYESADRPTADRLKGAMGVVPAALAEGLSDGFFRAEAGIAFAVAPIVGGGTFLVARGTSALQRRVLAEVHAIARQPHRYMGVAVMFPLDAAAVELVSRPPEAPSAPTAGPRDPAPQPVQPAQPPLAAPALSGDTAPPAAQQPLPQVTAQPRPSETPTTVTAAPAATGPTCSANLPPGQYQHCLNGQITGYFRNHHP